MAGLDWSVQRRNDFDVRDARKTERARISERTIAGLKVARAKGKIIGRPPVSEETIQKVLSLNRNAGMGARKIAKSTGHPLGTVNAILTRSRQQTFVGKVL